MIEIIPALLVHDQQTFELRLKQVSPFTKVVQVDVTDGSFVKNHTWFNTVNLIEEDFDIKYWLHLMIDDPLEYITNFPKVEIRHIKGITAHVETLNEDTLDIFVDLVQSLGVEVGVAGNVNFNDIKLALKQYNLDEVLVMGVNPGHSAEPVLDDTVDRIKSANLQARVIAVDGGVNETNIDKFIKEGATRFYLSSYIFNNENPLKVLEDLRNEYV